LKRRSVIARLDMVPVCNRAAFWIRREPSGCGRPLGTSTDIQEERRKEQVLQRTERMALAGRLAASIAHEINNPLESVTNLLFLSRHATSLETARQYLDLADSELSRVSQIATQTLRFHRQSSRAAPSRIFEILDNVLALYHGRISNAGLRVQRQYRETDPVTCFADEIRQVFANLISNAVDATPNGGTVVVRKRQRKNWRTGQAGVRVTIADSGHGMSPETRRQIFEAFFTTKELIEELMRRKTFLGVVVHSEQELRGPHWTGEKMFQVHLNENLDPAQASRLLDMSTEGHQRYRPLVVLWLEGRRSGNPIAWLPRR